MIESTLQLEDHLRTAAVDYYRVPPVVGGGGHPHATAAVFDGGVSTYVKFEEGMVDGFRAVRNEVAAFETIKLLEWDHMIGTTVLRELESPKTGTTGFCSVQVYWPDASPGLHQTAFGDTDIWRAATFDYLIQHSDRASQNWLGVQGTAATGQVTHLKLIDHGFAFDWPGRSFASAFTDMRRGQPMPEDIIQCVVSLESRLESSPVSTLLAPETLSAVNQRARHLLQYRCIP